MDTSTLFSLFTFTPVHDPTLLTNTTTTTTSSNNSLSSTTTTSFHHHQDQCSTNPFMDEDDFSSSSTHHHHHHDHPPLIPPPVTTNTTTTQNQYHQVFDPIPTSTFQPNLPSLDLTNCARWASPLLLDCARAVSTGDSSRIQQTLWMLNELSSPYGDPDQKIAAYFLQGLFARVTDSGPRTYRTLVSAAEKSVSFDSTRKTMLRFQEASPWSTFGHVAANGAILEAFDGAARLHIVDISTTHCTQWPTLLEALATRADDTPHLRLTVVVPSVGAAAHRVMKEIGQRIEKFARLMGVPFKFSVVYVGDQDGSGGELDVSVIDRIEIDPEEVVAVNCMGSLRRIAPGGRRDDMIAGFRRLRPKIMTIVEEEADMGDDNGVNDERFFEGFRESLQFFTAYMDSLDESFPKTNSERLMLERAAGRAIVDVVACPALESVERRERAANWIRRLNVSGFSPAAFSDDVSDDVRALLKRYKEGWTMTTAVDGSTTGVFLAWREQLVVWASAWRM